MARLAALAALACLAALPAQASLVVMRGYADYTSATLWMQSDRPGPLEIEIGRDGEPPRRFTREALAAEEFAAVVRVPGLAPGTAYRFRVRGGGEAREGELVTQRFAAHDRDAPALTIAIGSCHYLPNLNPLFPGGGGDFQIFDAIAAKSPDLMLWLGDNLYLMTPDLTDPTSMAARYRQNRAFGPLQRLLTATAHLAIWDDHDYGPNDSDRTYAYKGDTLRLFKRYWPNPGFGLPEVPGTFGWARLSDIEIFLLDDRYYRSPSRAPDTPDKTMFGAAQLAWLKDALLSSRARIKLVASGSQFFDRVSRFEGLHDFPREQREFAAWLLEQRIDGVILLSGDRHFGELLKIERDGAYPLYEYTSSPLTSSPVRHPDEAERSNPDVVPGTLRNQRQFGLLRFTGPADDRRIAFEGYDSNGLLLWRHEIAANDLRFPGKTR